MHQAGQRLAERVVVTVEPYPQRPPERPALEHDQGQAGYHAEVGQVRERGPVPVLHPLDPELPTDRRVGEPGAPALDVRLAGPRDRVAVRVVGRPAEQFVDAVEQPVGHRVLQGVRLVVHLVRGEPDDADQESLQQPVPADHVPGVPGAVRRERRPVVRALDEPVLGEPAEHRGHGRCGDAQMAGQRGGGHLVATARQHEDGPQRVFGRGGGHEPAAGP